MLDQPFTPGSPRRCQLPATTAALSRQPVACVLQNVTDPRHRRGVRHVLPRGLVPGGGGGVGRQFDGVRGTPPI